MQTLLAAIGGMQKSIENLQKGKHPQMEQTVNEFPYPSRGEFNVGGSSKQQTKKQKQLRRAERKEAFYGNNELSADRSPNPNFQGRWRKEQSEAPTNDRKRSADDRFCSYHNSFAHWENDCRALKRMKNGPQSEINVLQHQHSEANASTAKLPLVLIGFTDSKNRPLYVIADTGSTPNLVARSCVLNNDLQNKVKQISQMNKAIGEGNGV